MGERLILVNWDKLQAEDVIKEIASGAMDKSIRRTFVC